MIRILVVALLAICAPLAGAQTYPSKPVRVVIPYPPGGGAEAAARLLSLHLTQALGQSFVIDPKPGGNTLIGTEMVAKAPADGYTLLMSSGGMVSVNPHLYPRMPFDPARDLTPVAAAARVAVYLVCKPSLPAANAQEFVAYLRAHPDRLSYGSPGQGSSPHLAAEMFTSMTGTHAVHVPYRGAAPALNDLLAGQIDFAFDPGIGLSHVRAGRLKLLAIGSPRRSPRFPNVPTLDEAGLKGFDADTYFGFYAPANTPAAVITRLNLEINKILHSPSVMERVAALGGVATPMPPQQFAVKAAEEFRRFGTLIKERKITAD
jgi:tripartite-type tricarboxylate transporter receptor subunit TctC